MKRICTALLILTAVASHASAENWPHWRGPHYNGTSTEKNLPAKFSTTENVAWAINLPGASASSPIIVGDNVFVSTADEDNNMIAMCIDRKSGTEKWKHVVTKAPPSDRRVNKAAPTPVTDGETVVFFYGSGDLFAFNTAGEKLWHRSITKEYGDFAFQWTFSASPTLWEGTLFLPVLQRDSPVHGRGKQGGESYILAINPKTGKNLWRHVRPSKAAAESLESFTSLIPYTEAGRKELILAGGDCLTGHDPKTGKELWRWGTWNPGRIGHWRLVPSASAGGGVVLACAPKKDPIYAVKLGLEGDHSGKKPLWKSSDRDVSSDVCTPTFYNGKFYILNGENQVLSCVEPMTGKVLWKTEKTRENQQLGRALFRASPTVADGKVYLINHDADAWVLDASNGKTLHSTSMATGKRDLARASVAVSQGNLFIKAHGKLFCIGPNPNLN